MGDSSEPEVSLSSLCPSLVKLLAQPPRLRLWQQTKPQQEHFAPIQDPSSVRSSAVMEPLALAASTSLKRALEAQAAKKVEAEGWMLVSVAGVLYQGWPGLFGAVL